MKYILDNFKEFISEFGKSIFGDKEKLQRIYFIEELEESKSEIYKALYVTPYYLR